MKALQRKLLRDAWQLRGQALAIALVVIGGIATLVMALSNYQALQQTRERFYQEHRFADLFASLQRAPSTLLDELAALPGVQQAEGRVQALAQLELADFERPLTGQLVSLPQRPGGLNQLYLRSGHWPAQPWEAVLGEAFALAHGLQAGDALVAIVNGRRQELRIRGIGLSPEFTYPVRPGELFPDFMHFAVLWLPHDTLAGALDLEGAFNQLALELAPEATETAQADLIAAVDRLLQPYGGRGSHGRELQFSHRMLQEELLVLRAMSRLFGLIFLGVTAFLLSVVSARLIRTQQEQIALLKAFGYRNRQIAAHYASLVLLLVSVGVLPGLALGAWLGRGMAELYASFYHFPYLDWGLRPELVLLACAFVLSATALGTVAGLWRAWRLAPAAAMRPPSPARFAHSRSERLLPSRWLPPSARMVARQLERHPGRTLLSVLGIALAGGILILSRLQAGAIDEIVRVQFDLAQREHLSLVFTHATPSSALAELASLPGVLAVEGVRHSPVRLRHGPRSFVSAVQGLPAQSELRRVLDANLQAVDLPAQGLLLTKHLAQMLHIRPGQTLQVEFLDGRRDTLWLPVAGTVQEYLGVGVYARLDWLNALLLEGELLSGALLRIDPAHESALLQALRQRPGVATVSEQERAIAAFMDTMAEGMLTFGLIMTLLASSIAVGVVYNAARITLAERARDLASLRVLGYTPQEVRDLLLGELGALVLLALLPAFAIGYGLSALLVAGMQNELFRIPLVVTPQAFALGGLVMLLASALAAWWALRRLSQLDLVAVLKTRE